MLNLLLWTMAALNLWKRCLNGLPTSAVSKSHKLLCYVINWMEIKTNLVGYWSIFDLNYHQISKIVQSYVPLKIVSIFQGQFFISTTFTAHQNKIYSLHFFWFSEIMDIFGAYRLSSWTEKFLPAIVRDIITEPTSFRDQGNTSIVLSQVRTSW